MLNKVLIIGGISLSVLGIIFIKEIAFLLGATDELLNHCVIYGSVFMASLTPFMLTNTFQSFLVTAEKPDLGLKITIAAGITNIILDFLFIGMLILPLIFELDGIWFSIVAAETIALFLSLLMFKKFKSKYGY